MPLPDPTLWLNIDPANEQAWDDFMGQNDLWHNAIYQSITLNGLQTYTKKPNYYGGSDIKTWLAAQQQEHQGIAGSLQIGQSADLYDVDPKNTQDMQMWMAAHAMEHLRILQATTSPITAKYNFSYNYSTGWLDTVSVSGSNATIDGTPFYRYPINPPASWGTFPATLGDGATYPFEDGNVDGWFASGSGISVSSNTNSSYAYSGEGSLACALSLGASSGAAAAVQLNPAQALSANNLYAMVYFPANSYLSYNLWFQDSSGNRANSAAQKPGSGAGWYNIQYANGDAGASVPSGMNWNSIEYVGVTFSTGVGVPNPLYSFGSGTDGWAATSYSQVSVGASGGNLTFSGNGRIQAAAPGAPLNMEGAEISVPFSFSANPQGDNCELYLGAIDSGGNLLIISYATTTTSTSGTFSGVINSVGSFNAGAISTFNLTLADLTDSAGTLIGEVGTFSTSGSGFSGTVYVDHVNIGNNTTATPAPMYGWGVSLPSFLGLRPLESVVSSTVTFTESDPSPATSSVLCRVSTDNGSTWGAWNACTSGQPIPGLTTGVNGQQLAFQFNVKMYGESSALPTVSDIQVTVNTTLTLLEPLY